jgi:PAS domain S-box-containing protein
MTAKKIKSEGKVRILLNLLSDPAIIVNTKGLIVMANDEFWKVVHLSRKDMIGKSFLNIDVISDESRKIMLENLTKRLNDSRVEPYDIYFTVATGEKRVVEVKGKKINYAGQPADLVVFHDITSRKENERKLEEYAEEMETLVEEKVKDIREAEEKYRYLFNTMPSGVAVYKVVDNGTDFVFVDFNQTAEKIENKSKQKLIGKLVTKVFPGVKELGLLNVFQRVYQTGQAEYWPCGIYKDERVFGWRENWVYKLPNGDIVSVYNDVTEKKKGEEALRASEAKYRELINRMNDTAWVIGLDGKFMDANDAATRVLGYSREELISMGPYDIDSTLSKEQIIDLISRMPADQNQVFETTHTSKDGKTIPVEISSSIITYKGKKAVLSIARDITERKQGEVKLREAEKRYRALFDQAPLGILIIDPVTSKAVEFNDEAHRQLGYSREEFAKLRVSDYEVIETSAETIERMERILKGDREEYETKRLTKNGEIRDVRNTVQLIELSGKKFFHLITRDITARKKLENELERERDKLEAVTENVGAGLAIIGRDYRIMWVNSYLKKYHPSYEGKQCYSTFNKLETICPDCGVRKVFEDGVSFDSHEYAFTGRDGKPMWVELIVTPIKDEDGNIIAALELTVDITEKKLLENKLKMYSEDLEQIVTKRNKQLQLAQAKLLKAEKLAAIGELAGMVGHDLRNPLSAIRNAAYYLRQKQDTASNSIKQEMLEVVDTAILRADKIINDLLDYSREIHIETTDVSIRSILKEALSHLQIPNSVKIEDETLEDPWISADKDRLVRVFINLIKNAVEAMPHGGTLKVKSTRRGDYVRISFADTGIGMSKEDLSNLFIPLVTTKAQGMGFGLAVCKRFVEAHGGKITVKSVPGKGSVFTVTLPIQPQFKGELKTLINLPTNSNNLTINTARKN